MTTYHTFTLRSAIKTIFTTAFIGAVSFGCMNFVHQEMQHLDLFNTQLHGVPLFSSSPLNTTEIEASTLWGFCLGALMTVTAGMALYGQQMRQLLQQR